MAEFTRHKSLSHKFNRLQLDEQDLYRIATIVNNLSSRYSDKPKISIATADGEETIVTDDPSFFVSADMPRHSMKSVSISYRSYKNSLGCNIELPSLFSSLFYGSKAEMKVDGDDAAAVSGIFHELKRELDSRSASGSRLLRFIDSFWGDFLIGFLLAAATLTLLDKLLSGLRLIYPGFTGSGAEKVYTNLGMTVVVLVFAAGGRIVARLIHAYFPWVEFTGKLSDSGSRSRFWLYSFFSMVGTIVGALSLAALYDLLKYLLNFSSGK